MGNEEVQLPPGFRFHPTDEELILYYLRNQVTSLPCPASIIAEVDIYKFDPWDLPGKATFGDKEWYFFSPRDRKYPNGMRPNRAAGSGYWKATGTDKVIQTSGLQAERIGVKKALVFYRGRPPKGVKTSWIMNEYRLVDSAAAAAHVKRRTKHLDSMRLDDWVLCRIYRRSNGGYGLEANTEAEFKLPKSFSRELLQDEDLSVLSRFLYDNPMGVGYHVDHATLNGQDGEEGTLDVSHKRQRTSVDYLGEGQGYPQQKKFDNSCISYANSAYQAAESPPRCSLLTQPFLPQNTLLTSNLGFQ